VLGNALAEIFFSYIIIQIKSYTVTCFTHADGKHYRNGIPTYIIRNYPAKINKKFVSRIFMLYLRNIFHREHEADDGFSLTHFLVIDIPIR